MPRSPHTLLVCEGVLGAPGAPSEEWSFGLRATGGVTGGGQTLGSGASLLMGAFATHLAPFVGDNLTLTSTYVASVTGTETWAKDSEGMYQVGRWNGSVAGTSTSGSYMPAQSALAISLVTSRSGPTGKGRFFLPLGRALLEADGRLSPVTAGNYADAAQDFLNEVNNFVGQVVVASSTGTLSPVTAVRVGRVVDTLRSRRRSQVEEYAFRSLPG